MIFQVAFMIPPKESIKPNQLHDFTPNPLPPQNFSGTT